jgi:hypothetical protein
MRITRALVASAALVTSAIVANAHHSYAMFDTTQVVRIKGVLKTLEWTNPHVWLFLDVEDKDAKTTSEFGFESLSPAQLMRDYAWEKRLLKTGDTLTVEYAPLRSGNKGGALIKITLGNGRVLETRLSAARAAPPSSSEPAR